MYLGGELVHVLRILGLDDQSEITVNELDVVHVESNEALSETFVNLDGLIHFEVDGITRVGNCKNTKSRLNRSANLQ